MRKWLKRMAGAAALVLAPVAAMAQDAGNVVAVHSDWLVLEGSNPKQCWISARPARTVNTDASGNIKQVRRGDIYMLVFYQPGAKIKGQVQFAGGYPFRPGSAVKVQIGDASYDMNAVDGESAWPQDSAQDARLVSAMKRGASALVTGRSSRGTITKDTFSLKGFTAAVNDAAKRCGQ